MKVQLGQHSSAGVKTENQDFHGALVPDAQALVHKGIAIALADGISSSDVAHIASEIAVKSFLTDYYCTSDAWSVRTAASKVIQSTNSWLFSQSKNIASRDRGYITTFSGLVLKGRQGHLFHVGDSRIWRLSGNSLECLTEDHRLYVSETQSHLNRAFGLSATIEIDYRAIDLKVGDTFVLTTDGVHEFLSPAELAREITSASDLDATARTVVERALDAGSTDNLTIQIVRVQKLPDADAEDMLTGEVLLPAAPIPTLPGYHEGYRLLRNLQSTSRSHIFLAEDEETGVPAVLKFPSMDLRDDPGYLRRLALEEWVARRISSPHVLRPAPAHREKQSLFVATEFVDGQTLRQWMTDNPLPDLETVRGILEQIAKGLRAFHRKEMVHQDLRPENIMIDTSGTVKIIDFGSVRIAGVMEAAPTLDRAEILGTHQYTAPEVFLGYLGTERSDQFSLGVIAYEMLTGRLPFGGSVARATSERAQSRLRYRSAVSQTERVPEWVDRALSKAVNPVPGKRYEALSEFIEDLRRPNPRFQTDQFEPLAVRNPVLFWQLVSAFLAAACLFLVFQIHGNS
ncbi:bifunctional protein-serine/threonine kinase/phosphatase [Labrenzia aggregata]|uniref:Bifunctional protein-serine/threonine kinase/phosphatase n=1 Tax=Roseibium aggregatum TaxID=187304 RepID=A0A939E9U3_9HYPH|nr:bifunctional protein-serine/threonine kinase/phosphatase [Roseibium aggregatum]